MSLLDPDGHLPPLSFPSFPLNEMRRMGQFVDEGMRCEEERAGEDSGQKPEDTGRMLGKGTSWIDRTPRPGEGHRRPRPVEAVRLLRRRRE